MRFCSHEGDSEDKGRGRRGVVKQHTSFRDTATRSNGFKVIKTRARPISARLTSMGDLLCLFYRSTAVREGVNRKRHISVSFPVNPLPEGPYET